MGIPIVPPAKAIQAKECLACFDPGETPEVLWCMIAGVERGPGWAIQHGPAPNGVYPLVVHDNCQWKGLFGDWAIGYATGIPGSILSVINAIAQVNMEGTSVANCAAWLDVEAIPPQFDVFVNGYALLAFTGDCPLISLEALSESVGLHPGPDLFSDGWPKNGEEAVILFANVPESTRVRILLDCS